MKEYCETPLCQNRSVREVRVSVDKPSDQVRSLCANCKEAYTWGLQHGKATAWSEEILILTVADKGVIVHVEAFRSEDGARKGLLEYLREYQFYEGGDDEDEISKWLEEHDERLSVDMDGRKING